VIWFVLIVIEVYTTEKIMTEELQKLQKEFDKLQKQIDHLESWLYEISQAICGDDDQLQPEQDKKAKGA